MSNDPFEQPPGGFEPPLGAAPPSSQPPPNPPPPPSPPPPVARQLVRDPYTKLGGVASGLAHHYGLDVSLVRILFVLFTVVSGFGLPIYLLAWLIIPRAEYWPPVGAHKSIRSLSAREIGIGLLLIAALVVLFFDGGGLSQVLVPLVLIGGGIWLLTQPPAPDAVPAGDAAPGSDQAAEFGPVDTVIPDPVVPDLTGSHLTGSNMAGAGLPLGSPVPPKRRRWRPFLIGAVLLLIAVPVAAISALLASDIDLFSDFSVRYQPESVESIPGRISHDQGEVVVDLTELTPSMFDGEPVVLDIEHGLGEVRVVVPEGLDVDVDASAGVGDVKVFGSSDSGVGPELSVSHADPDLELNVELGVGDLTVTRG